MPGKNVAVKIKKAVNDGLFMMANAHNSIPARTSPQLVAGNAHTFDEAVRLQLLQRSQRHGHAFRRAWPIHPPHVDALQRIRRIGTVGKIALDQHGGAVDQICVHAWSIRS